jgi:hypothetical protein
MKEKIKNSIILELILLKRNYFFWIISLLIFLFIPLQSYFAILEENPGGALTSSSYVVQCGIFIFLFFGKVIHHRERASISEELFNVLPSGYTAKIYAKLCTLIIIIIAFFVISTCLMNLMYFIFSTPFLIIRKSASYIFLYWAVPFLIAGLLGVILNSFIKTKLIYVILVLIGIVIGPLNISFLEVFMSLLKIDLTSTLDFINLGQTDPYAPFDPVYGFPLEIYRWLQKLLIFCVLVIILLMQISFKEYGKYFNKVGWFLIPPVFIMLICFYLNSQDNQVIYTSNEFNSVRKYDLNYYKQAPHINNKDENENALSIESYNIDIKSFRSLSVSVKIGIISLSNLDNIKFTLYHRLKVEKILDENNNSVGFKQDGDLLAINMKLSQDERKTLQIKYSGVSSPYFYANEQAIMLPSYFPWIPLYGYHPAMVLNDSQLIRWPLNPDKTIDYSIKYTGPGPLFTNLPKKSSNLWEGKTSHGVTLAAGMLKEKEISGTKIVYPVSLGNMLNYVPNYLAEITNISNEIRSDLNINETPQENNDHVFFLSVPVESPFTSTPIWNLGSHRIIGVNQMYNSNDFFKYDIVPSVLDSLIRNPATTEQFEFKELFVRSYDYWYKLKHPDPTNKSEPFIKVLRDIYRADEKLTQKTRALNEIIQLLESNKDNETQTLSFLQMWLEKLQKEEFTDWNYFIEFLSSYKEHTK